MNEIALFLSLFVSALTILTLILNMSDRAKKEGARAERVNTLFEKIDMLIDRVKFLEKEVLDLRQGMRELSDENEHLRRTIRELSK